MAKLTALFALEDKISAKIEYIERATSGYINTLRQAERAGDSTFNGMETSMSSASAMATSSFREIGRAGDMAFDSIADAATQSGRETTNAIKSIDHGAESLAGTSSKAFGIVAKGFMAIGTAAIAGATMAVRSADSMNKALNSVQMATGATDNEMAGLNGIMTNIYNSGLGESLGDVGKSLSTVRQISGASGVELEKLTTNALMLRDTFDMDVNESMRTAHTMMKEFGVEGDQAYTLIAQAAQRGANKNGDLLDSLNEYGVHFRSLGFDAEQFTSVLIDGAANGAWSIDKVGDAMKEFNIRAKDGSKASADGFTALGLDAAEMTARFAMGGDVAQTAFQQVMSAMESIQDPVARNAAGVGLFGTQFEDLEAKGILAFGHISKSASMSANTLKQMDASRLNSFGDALSLIGRNVETKLLIPIGNKLLPVLRVFTSFVLDTIPIAANEVVFAMGVMGSGIDTVSGYFTSFKQLLSDNSTLLTNAALAIVTVFAPALISSGVQAMIAGTRMATSLIPVMVSTGVQSLIAAGKITGGLVVSLASYAAQGWKAVTATVATTMAWAGQKIAMVSSTIATYAMSAAQWALNAAFWANPMTWVVAGVIALIAAGYLLATNWDYVKAKTLELWDSFIEFTNSAITIGSTFVQGIIDGFMGKWEALKATATGIWDSIKSIFSGGVSMSVSPGSAMVDGSHANGLDYVPYDGYVAELHKGESVLTASETEAAMNTSSTGGSTSSGGNSTSIGSLIGSVTINNEADIAKIIKMIEQYLREQLNSSGDGVYDV